MILYGGKIRAQGPISELLTVKGSSRITMPDLPDEAMEQIVSVIKKNGGTYTLDHPRMSLEDFFLDVVNRAKRESVETSGATSGGEIADYLSGGDSKEKLEVLAGLKKPEPPKPEPVKAEPRVDEQRLTALESDDVPKEEPEDAKELNAAREQLNEANQKLKDLLSGKKDL